MNRLSLLPIYEVTHKYISLEHNLNTKENERKRQRVGDNNDVLKSVWGDDSSTPKYESHIKHVMGGG